MASRVVIAPAVKPRSPSSFVNNACRLTLVSLLLEPRSDVSLSKAVCSSAGAFPLLTSEISADSPLAKPPRPPSPLLWPSALLDAEVPLSG